MPLALRRFVFIVLWDTDRTGRGAANNNLTGSVAGVLSLSQSVSHSVGDERISLAQEKLHGIEEEGEGEEDEE